MWRRRRPSPARVIRDLMAESVEQRFGAGAPRTPHESFVKTFKRDYVYLNELHTAASVMQQLAGWFEDDNQVHPHKGCGRDRSACTGERTANA
jgi:hypothetical protein